jgi:hypothetical protein
VIFFARASASVGDVRASWPSELANAPLDVSGGSSATMRATRPSSSLASASTPLATSIFFGASSAPSDWSAALADIFTHV